MFFQDALHRRNPATLPEVEGLRALTATSYAFCDRTLNRLRGMVSNRAG